MDLIQSQIKWPQYLAVFTANIGTFSTGMIIGWPSPAGPRLETAESGYNFSVDFETFSWVAAVTTLISAISSAPTGLLMDWIGRKWTMLLMSVTFLIGWICMIFAQSVIYMLIGRALLGISLGATYVTVPQYTGEISDKEIRGFLTGMLEWTVTLGVLCSYIIGAFVNVHILSILCVLFPLIYTILFSFMPETPTFLVCKNRKNDAMKSIKWLRGKNFNAQEEIDEIIKEKEKEQQSGESFFKALSRKSSIRAVLIGLIVMSFQPLSGITAMLSYTTKIFNIANTNFGSDMETIIVGIAFTVTTFFGILFIDKLGRRKLLLISGLGITVCHIVLGVFFLMQENDDDRVAKIKWLPLTFMCLFIIFYAIGFGPVPCVVVGEILPADIKGKAAGTIMALNSVINFLVAKFFPTMTESIGPGATFITFASLCILGTIVILFLVPETKGKSLIEIQRMLERK